MAHGRIIVIEGELVWIEAGAHEGFRKNVVGVVELLVTDPEADARDAKGLLAGAEKCAETGRGAESIGIIKGTLNVIKRLATDDA